MRTLLPLLLLAAPALGQTTRIVVLRPGHRPIVLNRRAPVAGSTAGSYAARIPVVAPNRFDWQFAAPPGLLASMPKDAPGGFAESFQLLVPPGFQADKPVGLILNLSASSAPDDFNTWDPVCRRFGLVYACPVGVGDDAHAGLRLRTALSVLDDLRQRLIIDPDRTYVAGIGQGALTACQVAYTYPEFLGGLVAVGGATSLRAEPWMRDRVRHRLSVVLVGGALDPTRHELERVRAAVLKENEVSHRMLTVPGMAKGLPPAGVLEQAVGWLESGRLARLQMAKVSPTLRIPERVMPAKDEWATATVGEAKGRIKAGRVEEGLMQLEGVTSRWPTTAAAKEAKALLDEHDAKGKRTWQEVYDRRQLAHFNREAVALDDYATALAGVRGAVGVAGVVEAAIAMYEQVEKFGVDTREGRKATERLATLRKVKAKP